MRRYFQYGLSILLGAFILLSAPSAGVINTASLVLILLFGIPHGAVDHKIHASTSGERNLRNYIIKYVLIALGYVVWWLLAPLHALVIFILLSSFHFGQELLEDHQYKGKNALIGLSWGLFILTIPIFLKYAEIKPYLEAVAMRSLPDLGTYFLPILLTLISLASLSFLVLALVRKEMTIRNGAKLVFTSLFIVSFYLLLPFLAAFTIYFLLFHSLNAFTHQYRWLVKSKASYSVKKFISDLSLFSLVALAGLGILLVLVRPSDWNGLISYFFIFTSLITLPHAITFDQFYQFRKESEREDQLVSG